MDISQLKQKKKTNSRPDFSSFLNKDIKIGNFFGDKKKERFYSELSTLLQAGVDIKASLEIILDQTTNKQEKNIYKKILTKIISGNSLSEALDRKKYFTEYEYYTLKIGEETGTLGVVLEELSSYYKQSIKQKRQIISALSYPIIVVIVAFFALGFMISFIVPMFADVFKRLDSDLPAITQFVVNLSEKFPTYATIVFIILVSIVVISYTQRNTLWYRHFTSRIVMRIPFIGTMLHKIYLSRFATMMNLMISAQLPLLQAIQLIQKMIRYYPLEVALADIEQRILRGDQLHVSMDMYKIFPKRMVSLVRVGEEVGQVNVFFAKISKQYREEVEHMSSVLGNLIEPLLLVFLGLVVGFILVSMYLPLFQLSAAFE